MLTILYLIVIFAIFYLFLIRPQQQRAKEHGDLVAALAEGDRIVTAGGIYGMVKSVDDETVLLEVAPNVELKMAKDSVILRETGGETPAK